MSMFVIEMVSAFAEKLVDIDSEEMKKRLVEIEPLFEKVVGSSGTGISAETFKDPKYELAYEIFKCVNTLMVEKTRSSVLPSQTS